MHNLKSISILLLILFTGVAFTTAQSVVSPTWENEIKVMHGPEEFPGKVTHYAYSTLIYETDKGDISKMVLEEINSNTADKTKKKALKEGVPVALPAFDGEEIALKVKSEDVKNTNQVRVCVAFMKDSMDINPDDFAKEHESAQTAMRNLSIRLNKAVVSSQIEDANSTLTSMQKDFDKLVKDSMGLASDIMKANAKIEKLNMDNMKQEQNLSKANAQAASLEVMANSDAATEKDMKKYSKAKSKANSIESSMLKNNQNITKEQSAIKEAEMEQPMVRKQISELAAEIDAQKELITQLQAKLEAIK